MKLYNITVHAIIYILYTYYIQYDTLYLIYYIGDVVFI